MSQVQEITTDEEFASHTSSLPASTLLVLSFHTPWAAPCVQMNTVLSTLASAYPVTSPPSTSWISVNAEELPDVSDTYDVTAVPFLVLQRGGQVLETVSGSDASKVRSAIERHTRASASGSDSKFPLPEQTGAQTRSDTAKEPALVDKEGQTYTPSHPPSTTGFTNDTSAAAQTAPPTSNGETSKEDLEARLSQLVKAAPVMLFMKGSPSAPQCGFSRQLVGLLREKGVRYGFFNILADDEVRQGLKEWADWPTFPQLWVGGELVGGLDIVKEEMASDPEFLGEYVAKTA
jgi:Grx4 family monothiol glutaredoxin